MNLSKFASLLSLDLSDPGLTALIEACEAIVATALSTVKPEPKETQQET